jgi:cobalt-zinc-cadmium efflux system outer membrane protein
MQREIVEWDYEARRLEIAAATVLAFVDVLAEQRRLVFMNEAVVLAEKFAPAAQKRVDAGRASPVEVTRANVVTASARLGVEQQKSKLAVARKRLAALWGSVTPRFSEAVGDIEKVRDLPSLASATTRLARNPLLARRASDVAGREAELVVEMSKAHPDLTVNAGIRHFNESKDVGAVIGFSLPWPLFNKNQGGIAKAQAEIEKSQDLHTATAARLRNQLAIAYEQLENARNQITTYRESVMPQVEEAYKLTNEGYENGRFGYLEVLDASRTLVETRQQALEALLSYHKAVAEIEGLTGQALPSTKESSK